MGGGCGGLRSRSGVLGQSVGACIMLCWGGRVGEWMAFESWERDGGVGMFLIGHVWFYGNRWNISRIHVVSTSRRRTA